MAPKRHARLLVQAVGYETALAMTMQELDRNRESSEIVAIKAMSYWREMLVQLLAHGDKS